MNGGWYKQQRNIPERPWFKGDGDVVLLYTYLKATAYVADAKYQDHIIRRGSCPTTRAEMMEATGLSYKRVDRCLRKLINNNEILVKGYNKFSVVTICDYDSCGSSDGLFDDMEVQQRYNKGTTKVQQRYNKELNSTSLSAHVKEDKNNINLISLTPYKKERENSDDALKIKSLYNKTFSGVLPPCVRLSTATRLSVEECLRRFGMQSVDVVFAQIQTEQFSLGNNKTGFIANFSFIFTPRNYQQYLERALLSRQKKEQQPVSSTTRLMSEPQLSQEEREAQRLSERKTTLEGLVRQAQERPNWRKAAWACVLIGAYESGELSNLGIEWKPDNE